MSYGRSRAEWKFGVIGIGLSAATVVGWGLLTYCVPSTGSKEHTLRNEISKLRQQVEAVTAERNQLTKENERTILAEQDLNTMLVRIEAATDELQELDSLRATVSQAIEQARLQLTGPSDQSITMAENPMVSTTSAVQLSKQEIRAVQEALVDFGYGKLKADGAVGPSTRRAVEAFERAKGLPVTGKLGTATLQALRTHTASVTQ